MEQNARGGVTEDELAFVEDAAISLERQGLFRMAGRVLAWLLICDPPEQTAGDLVEVLQASKGSVSAATRFLVPSGMVERISRPGERRDYYRIKEGVWPTLAKSQADHYQSFVDITEQGLRILEDAPARRKERLQTMHDFYTWLAKEMPVLWKRWEAEQGTREGTRGA
ncbi:MULTISPECIES: MarR family transcriptional regulator [unclassified Streptomyces]|uniref:GbsR/MarR family transcriptional regulator n=1 Tax=unclassified Streptomyces TaxID=2593676 RepID=UPI0009338E67|nr:MarR family transcriptional regulator [Streptomyces sp. NBRC 110465]